MEKSEEDDFDELGSFILTEIYVIYIATKI